MYDWLRTAVLPHLHYVVTHANVGLDILRGIRRRLQFFPESGHKDAQGSDVIFPVAAPYALRDKGVSQNFADIP